MQVDADLIAEEDAPADAWAGAVAADHAAIHAQLDQLTAEYLARGGAIAVIEPGQPAAELPQIYRVSISNFTSAQHERHELGKAAHRYPGDTPYVACILVNIGTVTSAIDLRRVMDRMGHPCSADKLDRLLRAYLAEDPRAVALTRKTRAQREAEVIERYPVLREQMSPSACAAELHMNLCDLKRIVALHGLDRRLEAVS